jgi:periplasmic divalent cation tolerance protein
MKNLIFYVTVPNFEEGKRIARTLVESKVAACVNLIKDVFSIYHWKSKIEEDREVLLIIKTSEKKSEELIELVNKNHSYELPECVGVKIEDGSKRYIDWINETISN